jgi:hypothetical protein
MCTVVVLRRPGHAWPLLVAGNRDEMADRPWLAPARHWADRADVVAGRDVLAGGTWLGLNDDGVIAVVLNRINTLGPAPGFRSRGELPLEALDHGDAAAAAHALADLDPLAYRPFNMIVADSVDGFWIRCRHGGNGGAAVGIDIRPLPAGLSMLTAYDLDDLRSPRTRRYRPLFAAAAVPDPDAGDWSAWRALLARRDHDADAGPGGAMLVATATGFGTVCASLIALPALAAGDTPPLWLFAAGPPDATPFLPVDVDAPPPAAPR